MLCVRSSVVVLLLALVVEAINNHWVLKDAKILQKVDSPFHMREPNNLVAFLEQIRYNEYVERSYLELLRKREQIVEHLRFSMRFGERLVDQAKCAMDFWLLEKRMSYLKITSNHLKRIDLPDLMTTVHKSTAQEFGVLAEPICEQVHKLSVGPATYDHLESFQQRKFLATQAENENDVNVSSETVEVIRRLAVAGLEREPKSWKFHTLSSYYWRMRGNTINALPCARLAVMLAPPTHKDIPLLSLGTILFRMGNLPDADVILSAAVDHAPGVAENHMVLGSALAMKHEFNRSIHHFDEAERLDPSTLPRTQQVRNFIGCLENLTKKTSKMFSYVEYMKNQVKEFKRLKFKLSQNHERLIQQQLPLGARFLDSNTPKEDLHRRGQYCSTRTPIGSEEPVLFCDFYSDMQMRLESKDVDINIEELERDLKANTEAIIRQVSTEIRKQLNRQQLRAEKAYMMSTTVESANQKQK